MCLRPRSEVAFTLVELLVVVAIVAMLIAILLPALSGARAASKIAVCASNLRQNGLAIRMYADAARGFIPRGPEPLHPYDFQSNILATNQIWIGDSGRDTHPLEHTGLGTLIAAGDYDARIAFCPADDNFNIAQVEHIGTARDAYGSYLYRQLDYLPTDAAEGRLDRLGQHVVDNVRLTVEVLALDTNSLGEGTYRHTNHRGRRANVLYRDGSVQAFRNVDNALAIPPEAFANLAGLPGAIDQLLSNADYSYRSAQPQQAPQLTGR